MREVLRTALVGFGLVAISRARHGFTKVPEPAGDLGRLWRVAVPGEA
jgi:hypothetical protein